MIGSKVDDQMLLISQFYPHIYAQLAQHQEGETTTVKPRRRRKKKKGEGSNSNNSTVVIRKRKLTEEQVNLLERSFMDEHKLETERKGKLASELGLDPHQVTVWFQNKRARWKNKKLEEEYYKLKTQHETTVIEKYRLETEVLKMKEQLCEAEKKIKSLLLERNCDISSDSTSSIFSMEQPHFLGEYFGVEGLLKDNNNNMFFVADYQSPYITLWDI